jgi:predicted transcriptional regulator
MDYQIFLRITRIRNIAYGQANRKEKSREIYEEAKTGENEEKERDSSSYQEALPFLISSSR